MIIVTGGAGFIGQNLVEKLIDLGYKDIVIIDNNIDRVRNKFKDVKLLTVSDSYVWLGFNGCSIDIVFHLGARTDTMETDEEIFKRFNLEYSKFIWEFCSDFEIPLIYASSAATYGDGEDGFDDNEFIDNLKPLNLYGWSKQNFDIYVTEQAMNEPPFWVGLKFFNVYGLHESHKGKMASVVYHFYNQIKTNSEINLFKSHVNFCADGEQKRDFIHVDDVVNSMVKLFWGKSKATPIPSDIYNLGTGTARTYNDLAKIIFKCLGKEPKINYIDTPIEIRDSYQYYTKANMNKFCEHMPCSQFNSLEQGIEIYINQLENESR